jgi:hypothetical protein
MSTGAVTIKGNIHFKIRFNTLHGDTDLYWRVITSPRPSPEERGVLDTLREEQEYLVRSVSCKVETHSDASFDKTAGKVKYNMAGACSELMIDEQLNAVLR